MPIPVDPAIGPFIEAPLNAIEDTTKRTRYGKVFTLDTGQQRLITSMSLVHVGGTDGEVFQDPDLSLVLDEATKTYGITRAFYRVTIPSDAIGYTYQEFGASPATLRLVAIDDQPVADLPLVLAPMIDGNRLVFPDVLPGLTLDVTCRMDRVGINKRVEDAGALHRLTWELVTEATTAGAMRWETLGLDNLNQIPSSRYRQRCELDITLDVGVPIPDGSGFVSVTAIETWSGQAIVLERGTRIKSLEPAIYPIYIDSDFVGTVSANNDDGEQEGASTWVELGGGYGDYWTIFAGPSVRWPGWRFLNVTVPQGATVSAATLIVHVNQQSVDPTGTLYADAVDNAPAWGNSSRPDQITNTTASTLVAVTATGNKSIDVKTIVQELLNRGGWVSGNAMRFTLNNITTNYPTFCSFDDIQATVNNQAAELDITYTSGAGPRVGATFLPILGVA